MRRRDRPLPVQREFSRSDERRDRTFATFDRLVLAACHAVRRHCQREWLDKVSRHSRHAGALIRAAAARTEAPQKPDDAALERQFGSLDIGFLKIDFEALVQLKVHCRCRGLDGVAARDGDAGHGDDDRVRSRLCDVDVATSGVHESLADWRDVRVPRTEP